MDEPWLYQIRVTLADGAAALVRGGRNDPVLRPLMDILDRHHAAAMSQLDAFEQYVRQAETEGSAAFPLYAWTKATLADPDKRAKHARSFALYVLGEAVYPKAAADRLEADLTGLTGGGLMLGLSRHDTNPANNLPVPPEYRA